MGIDTPSKLYTLAIMTDEAFNEECKKRLLEKGELILTSMHGLGSRRSAEDFGKEKQWTKEQYESLCDEMNAFANLLGATVVVSDFNETRPTASSVFAPKTA